MAEITVRNVRKSYGRTEIVHGVDLDIHDGEFIVILGPSGCGKSTLLRMVAGLESITSGEISISGRVVNDIEPRERGCAMVFQNYALYPHMSVAENIGYSLKVAGVRKAERMERIRKIAEPLGLTDYLDRRPAALSGGQRQRVAMGRAMIREPKVFLFDEPLSNLDARLRVQMRAELRRLHQRLKTTSIFVTHDQVEAMTLADRLVVINKGHIEQVGTPAEVYSKPATRFVAGFIGSPPMNLLEGTIESGGIFAQGSHARIPVPILGAAEKTGRRVTLGVRPEEIALAEIGTPGALAATVDFVEELGAGRIVQADLKGTPFAIAITDKRTLNPGDTINVAILPEAIHLYDGETGLRV
ncbi:sn-glycerol-3-phosphate import ATP-binding protein UgpC 2 [Labrys miyagiensis]|uniref:Sn-glycerol-3-phosphate import ATP-binding protein UgpC 2 n=1 Tax=Labrys miyagiensis TaxID=346912 RepID=A0ABQ6CU77_9HYPH|nr:sn-glycerol-3-phosphate import ATP-binding protein UgpC [Labrys miyagiensis]GLS23912.1 sn-glycerol-3-phosphate import ATP-binding protein UgpC 2 [Labrys miyagiensis]